ncbi:MAG: heavy-metal-associated domain-containing protein, partial [Bdellovibrionota bacterium]
MILLTLLLSLGNSPGFADSPLLADFLVKGMLCSSCSEKVSKALGKVPGVKSVRIEARQNRVEVAYDSERTSQKI